MSRFLYEKSISYQGNLIIPFLFARVGGEMIYSYALLSEKGYKSQFHKAKNPAGLCSNNLREILEIAKKHLDEHHESSLTNDYFQQRYTYQNHLIILHQEEVKCYYDHYLPHELRNIAAPTLFVDADECMDWIKQQLDRHRVV